MEIKNYSRIPPHALSEEGQLHDEKMRSVTLTLNHAIPRILYHGPMTF